MTPSHPGTEVGLAQVDDTTQQEMAAARALWEDLARRARRLHCPEHYAEPWRVQVIGDTPDDFRLYTSGCCDKLGVVVNALIRSDPRISGPH
jgi:hypothetical protein